MRKLLIVAAGFFASLTRHFRMSRFSSQRAPVLFYGCLGSLVVILMGCSSDRQRQGEPVPQGGAATNDGQSSPELAASKAKQLERILSLAAQALSNQDAETALQQIAAGLSLADELDDGLSKAHLLLLRGDIEQENGRDPEARRYYADATALFHVLKNDDGRVATLVSLASLEMRKGDNAAARGHLQEAEPLISQSKNPILTARYEEHLGRLNLRRLDYSEAATHLAQSQRIYKEAGDKRREAELLVLMAIALEAQGKDSASNKNLEAAAKIFREIGDPRGEAQALSRLAAASERDGRYSQARSLLSKVVDIYSKVGDPGAAAAIVRRMNSLPEDG
jgi:tetratricopeptide (TPR) repeat protein